MEWFPVYLSLKVALFSTLIVIVTGVPLGWLMAHDNIPGKAFLSSLVSLPMILPPTVLGYYLLVLIGRESFLGRFLEDNFGIRLIFTWQAAVIAAAVVSLPLVTRTVQASIESIDRDLEDVARTMGKSELVIFLTVTLPLSWQGILAGTVLAFARSMGEFGATLMVAGNIPGKTQTLSIAIYDAMQSGNTELANFLVVLITILSMAVLIILNRFTIVKRW
ncbi:MAG: molybdate ABC transporter permease subunit [Dethiobacter sp.]|nr:MAG: molybdate ABC transporter permease subunit [Dethiobacter sp.]